MPPMDDCLIVWEIKRPERKKLTELPEDLARAFQCWQKNINIVPGSSSIPVETLPQLLEQAKSFCIKAIQHYLGNSANQPGTELYGDSLAFKFTPTLPPTELST